VITRQREGLSGGFAGFFQKRFIEVEANAGSAAGRLDVIDDSDALPDALAAGISDLGSRISGPGSRSSGKSPDTPDPRSEIRSDNPAPAIERILEQAAPFADQLSTALERTAPAPGTAMAPLVAGRRPPALAKDLTEELVVAGLHPVLAEGVITETVSHLLPFSNGTPLDRLVRETLARRIPVQPSWTRRGRTVAFVGAGGSGKTLCTARLAAAYARGSDLPVVCMSLRPRDGGAELRALLEPHGVAVFGIDDPGEARARIAGAREHALIVFDTPTASPAAPAELDQLAEDLERIGVYEVHLTLSATTGGQAAEELLRGLSPLGVSRIVLTHADETGHVGPAVGLAIRTGRPFSYISSGTSVASGLMPANPEALAAAILP
jgi:hypothetical protein